MVHVCVIVVKVEKATDHNFMALVTVSVVEVRTMVEVTIG